MKKTKKLFAFLIVAVMVMAMGISAMAEGSGSIKITNAVAKRTYTAYKIFNATASAGKAAYTTDEKGKTAIASDENAPFTVTSTAVNGVFNVTRKESAEDKDIIDWISSKYASFGDSGTTGTFDGKTGTYTISGLDLGYYYVSTGNGSAVSIDTVTGSNKEIKDKNTEGPGDEEKKITAKDGNTLPSPATQNDAKVGSTETFEVTYKATNWVTSSEGTTVTALKVENFYIKDKPTGLSINKETVKVTVNGDEITKNTAYTISEGTNGELLITIPWVDGDKNFLYQPKEDATEEKIPVKVTYNATVTADAAAAAADNEVHIYYNHDPQSSTDGTEVTTPENPPKTTTDTYKFQLNKVDGDNVFLKGAKFELYDGTTKVVFVKNESTYRVAASGESSTTTTIDMTENTTVEIKGLDNKNYTLKEIQAPDGYTLAEDTTIGSTNNTDASCKLVKESAAYSDSANGKVTVINKAGSVLPSTGGIGTTIFYVLGAILALGAGILLITRRRMSARS